MKIIVENSKSVQDFNLSERGKSTAYRYFQSPINIVGLTNSGKPRFATYWREKNKERSKNIAILTALYV